MIRRGKAYFVFVAGFIVGWTVLSIPFSVKTNDGAPTANSSPAVSATNNLSTRKEPVEDTFREPWIEIHNSYFTPDDCQEIIRLAEEFGFPESADSIDYGEERSTVSWAIDVFTNKKLLAPTIANIYDKHLPKIYDLVREKKRVMDGDDTEPSLDWVFLRKYSAGAERYMLRLHSDTNLFTVNVALNDDYEGGGIFYQKNKDEFYRDDDPIPIVPDHLLTYEFLETLVQRKNLSKDGIVFPHLKQGDMMMHNYTLFHAIAPIQQGTRYSLVFFFDEHHRHVRQKLGEPQVVVVENHFDMPVDIYWINKHSAKLEYMLIEPSIPRWPSRYAINAARADTFVVKDPQTDAFVFEFEVGMPKDDEDDFYVTIAPDEWFEEIDMEDEGDEKDGIEDEVDEDDDEYDGDEDYDDEDYDELEENHHKDEL